MAYRIYYKLNDGCDCENMIMTLQDCMDYISDDMLNHQDCVDITYTIEPVWMDEVDVTELPELNF